MLTTKTEKVKKLVKGGSNRPELRYFWIDCSSFRRYFRESVLFHVAGDFVRDIER